MTVHLREHMSLRDTGACDLARRTWKDTQGMQTARGGGRERERQRGRRDIERETERELLNLIDSKNQPGMFQLNTKDT
ncbi:unnamed protein product [Boreogadus saida]